MRLTSSLGRPNAYGYVADTQYDGATTVYENRVPRACPKALKLKNMQFVLQLVLFSKEWKGRRGSEEV